jgi:hypothetical protein
MGLSGVCIVFMCSLVCHAASIFHSDSVSRLRDNTSAAIERVFPYSPIGVYKFEETLATTTIDGSGQGNHGTISGTGTTRINGARGTALSFNPSSNGKVTLSDIAVTNQVTVAAWMKIGTTTASARHAISRHPAWYLSNHIGNGTVRFAIKSAVELSFNFDTLTNIGVSEWHHYAGVYDGSMVYTYLDGVMKSSGTQSGNMDLSGSTRIGGYWNSATSQYTWNGSIDEVRIYDRALGSDTIRRLYLRGM